ncbi:MAG: glucose-1-phosphate cytidylyltransferase [Planctomycetales bacterium]|nr:glucose-1-phosphate cytidylyltransferase [Planctomycetales bacterium]
MQVVILCGGLGTRLREETEYRPKPMVFVGGRPILWHIMKTYAMHGHKEFILCLGYKGEVIKDYFLNYQSRSSDVTLRLGQRQSIEYHSNHDEEDWTVTMVDTGLKSMTGSRLRRVIPYLREETFLMTYGDGLTDSDVNASVAFHHQHGGIATLTAVPPLNRFGHLALNGSRVAHFEEKPLSSHDFVNGGYFVFDRRIVNYLDEGDDCVLEQAPLSKLAHDSELHAFRHTGFWQCMDTLRELELLNRLWESGEPPWRIW